MKPMSIEEVRAVQLNILDEVVRFCDENNIKYWLDSGTMLGAIRHQGYIPWDDDIDLGMLRYDYDKLIYSFNNTKKKENLFLDCVEINSDCRFPFAKIYDRNTVLYEEDMKLYINIDVFVYDNAPSDYMKLKWMYFKRDMLTHLNIWQWGNGIKSKSMIGRAVRRIFHPILQSFPKNYFCRKLIKNSRMYNRINTLYIGNFTSYAKVLLKKDYVEQLIKCSFEGKEYNVPIGYDMWLRAFYGDYMKLPPKEKRVGKHNIKAYRKED